MSAKKVQITKNYRLFKRSNGENRPLDLRKHRKLLDSMKQYGFLSCFPIVVIRDKKGDLIVKDGQHRLAFAEELGIAVHWIEEDVDFDVAIVNSTSKVWVIRDYAQKYAANGIADYVTGIEFAEANDVPIGIAFAMLSGTTSFGNCSDEFMKGTWRVKDAKWAALVASVYVPFVQMNSTVRKNTFLEACMAVCRVKTFSRNRLIENAERCRQKIVNYGTRDAYLDMLESIYNFGRRELVGLKAEALMAMRDRHIINTKKKKKTEKELMQLV